MPDHTKPTNEELEEKIKEAEEALDEEEKKDQEVEDKVEEIEDEQEEDDDQTDDQDDQDETDEDDQEDEEEEQKKDSEEKVEPSKKDDFEKRYKDSSREATILYNKNKKMAEAIEKAGEDVEVTEAELKAEYSDWDIMSDFEQKMARANMIHEKKLSAISEATKDFKEMDAWNSKVDSFVDDPETLVEHPELEGKEEEFKVFSTKPTHRGVDFDVLVDSFLYKTSKAVTKKTGKMLPTGSGGHQRKPSKNDGKLSVEDSIRLRKVNYKKYQEMLKKGKIRSDI